MGKKKGIGALNWTLLLVIGFSAQIAWVIENNLSLIHI